MDLLPSQWAFVVKTLTDLGLDPRDFEREVQADHCILRHRAGFYFRFQRTPQRSYALEHSPGHQWEVDQIAHDNWKDVEPCVARWGQYLLRELESGDAWAAFNSEDPDRLFTAIEVAKLTMALQLIAQHIQEHYDLTEEQLRSVSARLDDLKAATKTHKLGAWRDFFVQMMAAIAADVATDPAKQQALYHAAATAVQAVFRHLPLLTGS